MLHKECFIAVSSEWTVVKIVNIVNKSALQMFLFSNLCFAEGEEHTVLLYHEA